MNVGEALDRGRTALAGASDSAPNDARLLLADSLRRPTAWILGHSEAEVAAGEADAYLERVRRCASGEPLPYVLGWWEFFGRRFRVGPEVLIPRPETEILVEIALAELRRRGRGSRVVDVGTGSGCVAISLAAEIAGQFVAAGDVSRGALKVARENARAHAVEDHVGFVLADLLTGLRGPWDLVCANLPYVRDTRVQGRREPALALGGGPRGTDLCRRLIRDLPRALAPGGTAVLEIDHDQAPELTEVIRTALPDARSRIAQDLAGLDRFLVVERDG